MNCCTRPLLAFTWAFLFPPAARRYVRSTWNWSQVGSFWPEKEKMVAPWNDLNETSLKNRVLEGSGVNFGGPRPRFWRVLGTMFRFCHLFLASFPRNGCSQTQCQDCQESRKRRERRNGQKPAKTRTRSQTRQEWVGGGAPPPGGFNGILPKSRFQKTCNFSLIFV